MSQICLPENSYNEIGKILCGTNPLESNTSCFYDPTKNFAPVESGFPGKILNCPKSSTVSSDSGKCPLPLISTVTTKDYYTCVYNYCTGVDSTDTSWFDRWNDNTCFRYLNYNLFTDLNDPEYIPPVDLKIPNQIISPGLFINVDGFTVSQSIMNGVYDRYSNINGFVLGSYPGQIGYSTFQNNIYSICQNVPGLCSEFMNQACTGVTQDDLSIQPYLVPFCGCYMNNAQYAQYINQWGVNKECTPYCNVPGVIGLSTPSKTSKITCQQDTCIINDYTINLINSNSGAININQICSGCTSADCSCLVDGLSLNIYNSKINGNISLSQDCQNSTCSILNPNTGEYQTVQCQAGSTPQDVITELENEQKKKNRENIIINVIIWIVIIVIILLVSLFLSLAETYLFPKKKE